MVMKILNNLNREKVLENVNFASPYVELPKKLTVKENLEIYSRLYGIKDFKKQNIRNFR